MAKRNKEVALVKVFDRNVEKVYFIKIKKNVVPQRRPSKIAMKMDCGDAALFDKQYHIMPCYSVTNTIKTFQGKY